MSIESALIAFAGDMASRFMEPQELRSPESDIPRCFHIEKSEKYECPKDRDYKCKLGAHEKIVRKTCSFPGESIKLKNGSN